MYLALAFALAVPAVQPVDGVVIARPSPVALPAAAEVKLLERAGGPEEYEEARSDRAFALERFTYGSDGLEVSAYLLRHAGPSRRRPLVVYIRGSYVVTGEAPRLLPTLRRMAREGFVVVAPMLRGSDGMAGHDEMGGADRNDVRNAIAAAGALGLADTEATFLYGESRGGIMTLLALKDGLPVRAAATFGAITDLEGFLAADARAAALALQIWPDFATRRAEILTSRSALAWPDRLRAPLLLMHGANDPQVDISHTLRLAEALHRAGARFAVRIFDDDGHPLVRNRVERDRTAAAFFRQFLPE
jgi:dipeptidyl aminopeptidase/acylaminoacyl peptidase